MVAEYTADELADDSDDEKKIEKVEKAAERKAAKRKRALESAGGEAAYGASSITVTHCTDTSQIESEASCLILPMYIFQPYVSSATNLVHHHTHPQS